MLYKNPWPVTLVYRIKPLRVDVPPIVLQAHGCPTQPVWMVEILARIVPDIKKYRNLRMQCGEFHEIARLCLIMPAFLGHEHISRCEETLQTQCGNLVSLCQRAAVGNQSRHDPTVVVQPAEHVFSFSIKRYCRLMEAVDANHLLFTKKWCTPVLHGINRILSAGKGLPHGIAHLTCAASPCLVPGFPNRIEGRLYEVGLLVKRIVKIEHDSNQWRLLVVFFHVFSYFFR